MIIIIQLGLLFICNVAFHKQEHQNRNGLAFW